MDVLEKFIMKHTNAGIVYDGGWRYEDVTVLELDLDYFSWIFDWWAYRNVTRYPNLNWDEKFWLAAEENPRHPIICMQMALKEMNKVMGSLDDLQVETGFRSSLLEDALPVNEDLKKVL